MNFRQLISTLYLFPTYFFFQYLHHTLCVSGITHYVSKCHSRSLFNAHWNLLWSLSPEVHGTFWTTSFGQHLWFHGIPWNLSNKTSSSMEFHRMLSRSKVSWNSKELFPYSRLPWNSIELFTFPKKVPWNSILVNIVVDVWLVICYLATYCIDFYIVIRILNTPLSAKMAQGQRKWRAVKCFRILLDIVYVHTTEIRCSLYRKLAWGY